MNPSNGTTPWTSLVHRSIEARKEIRTHNVPKILDILQHWTSLDEFLERAPKTVMFWFFQRRQGFPSQKTMQKWSRDRLEDYVLLPAAPGFVLRSICFFVSHFWQTRDDPDPDGKYLRLLQDELQSQPWSYVWVDWTCIPQDPPQRERKCLFPAVAANNASYHPKQRLRVVLTRPSRPVCGFCSKSLNIRSRPRDPGRSRPTTRNSCST